MTAQERNHKYNHSAHGREMRRAYFKLWSARNPERLREIRRKYEQSLDRKKAKNSDPKKRARSAKWSHAANEKSRKRATLNREPWDVTDDAWLMENEKSMKRSEISAFLGRTIFAVNVRISKLKRLERTNG